MSWPAPDEEPALKAMLVYDKHTAKRAVQSWAKVMEAKLGAEFGCGGQMDHALMTAEWEQQQCANTQANGGPAAVSWALDVCRSLTPSCG